MAPKPKPYIRRVNAPEHDLVGWRIVFSRYRERNCRLFSDKKFGGNKAARQAALAFLGNNTEHIEELTSLMRRLEPRSNTRFDIPGITRVKIADGRYFWLAYWDENGRKVQKKFSIQLYGEDAAKELAIKARKKGVARYVKRFNQLKRQLNLE